MNGVPDHDLAVLDFPKTTIPLGPVAPVSDLDRHGLVIADRQYRRVPMHVGGRALRGHHLPSGPHVGDARAGNVRSGRSHAARP